MKSGIVLVNKSEGISSRATVAAVMRLFGEKKAGHTGTLDPLATGVLPVLIGRAVKASDYMLTSDKYYRAVMLLGRVTDTDDITGKLLEEHSDIPSKDEVLAAAESFIGTIQQIPPMYSALKIGGRKLCDLARAGIEVEREPRSITIHSLKVEQISDELYSLTVHCSKGTYIRTLIADIGKKLGCGATMSALERTRASCFSLEDCHTLDELEAMTAEQREHLIIPVERVFEDRPVIKLAPFFARLARCGVEIYLKKLGVDMDEGAEARLYDGERFFALARVKLFESGLALKPIIQFDIQ